MNSITRISAEYCPSIPRAQIVKESKCNFYMNDLLSLGNGFAIVASELSKTLCSAPSGEPLYRCVFPDGITGHLAKFTDGSGFIGTIMNETGIAAQARWIPVDGIQQALLFDPTMLVIASVLMSINKKMEQIKTTQAEILQFLHEDKESDLEGTVNMLSDTLEQYRYNASQDFWKSSKMTSVTNIKGKAESNIIFYRKQIVNAFENTKQIHAYQKADKFKHKLEHYFKYYQLSSYIYAYASFLEVILGNNYSAEYLDYISGKIRDYSYQYRTDYTNCYNELEKYMKGSLEAVALNGLGKAGKAAGKAIGKIPVLNKGPVDNALIAAGSSIRRLGSKHGKNAMRDFRNKRDAGIRMFLGNIDAINEMCNKPMEILFDKEMIYIGTRDVV